MSMEINGRYGQYQTDYAKRLSAEPEKTMESGNVQDAEKATEKAPVAQDEYISSEKSAIKPNGLYRLGQDEDGNKKLFFDDPKKAEEKCTGSTDEVDREIRNLQQKKQQLEQQIQSASGDEKKIRQLEQKLAQVEGELSRKDNDTYRRQHTTFSK